MQEQNQEASSHGIISTEPTSLTNFSQQARVLAILLGFSPFHRINVYKEQRLIFYLKFQNR